MSTLGIELTGSATTSRTLSLKPRELFASAVKFAIKAAAGNYVDAATELPDLANSIGISAGPEKRVSALLSRSLERSLSGLIKEVRSEIQGLTDAAYAASFVGLREEFKITIEPDFFRNPERSGVVSALKPEASRWLSAIDVPDYDARNIVERLPIVFARALHDEWRSNPAFYNELLSALDSPFASAAQMEDEWARYRTYVRGLAEERVFDESFSLRQIYIQPRCFTVSKATSKAASVEFSPSNRSRNETVKVMGWLGENLQSWLQARDREYAIRTIAGGPGSGKSSFAKIFAADLSEKGAKVLFVPLHQIDLDAGITRALKDFFVESGHFKEDPLLNFDGSNPGILILDGLDEIQMQGKAAQETARNFIDDLIRFVDRKNSIECTILCVVTGRDLAVQSADGALKFEGQVVHLTPYCMQETEINDYSDPKEIFAIDQRDEWWKKFGKLTGNEIVETPPELKQGELNEVSSQPLLNYLVALSYRRGLKLDSTSNVNSVYEDLLKAVYDRGWARHSHPAVKDLPYSSFVRLLEEVALAVWHGAGRTTTLSEVEEHCRQSKVAGLLPSFQSGVSSGVSALLIAFYFRQKGARSTGEKTFEFTHKSFAEYLTSLRVVRLVDLVSTQLQLHRQDSDKGLDEQDALHRWLSICGSTPIDRYLLDFIIRECSLRGKDAAQIWQSQLIVLLEAALRTGWPVHRLEGLKFVEQQLQLRNAEEALFACLNACARVTAEKSNVRWPHMTAFGETLKRLQGQRPGPSNRTIMYCLSYLDFDGQCLDMADLYQAALNNSSFRNAQLNYACLLGANLSECDLSGADMEGTNLDAIFDRTQVDLVGLRRSLLPLLINNQPKAGKVVASEHFHQFSNFPEGLIVRDEDGQIVPSNSLKTRLKDSRQGGIQPLAETRGGRVKRRSDSGKMEISEQ